MGCKYARVTDEYHGWECQVTEGECMFLYPSSKACAEIFGEGPDINEDGRRKQRKKKGEIYEIEEVEND